MEHTQKSIRVAWFQSHPCWIVPVKMDQLQPDVSLLFLPSDVTSTPYTLSHLPRAINVYVSSECDMQCWCTSLIIHIMFHRIVPCSCSWLCRTSPCLINKLSRRASTVSTCMFSVLAGPLFSDWCPCLRTTLYYSLGLCPVWWFRLPLPIWTLQLSPPVSIGICKQSVSIVFESQGLYRLYTCMYFALVSCAIHLPELASCRHSSLLACLYSHVLHFKQAQFTHSPTLEWSIHSEFPTNHLICIACSVWCIDFGMNKHLKNQFGH